MADCEQNILSIPVYSGTIPNTAVIMITFNDGSTVISTWATILGSIISNDIEFVVGSGVGSAPDDGDTVFQDDSLIGKRVRVFRQGLKQPTSDPGGGYYYSFNNVTGEISPSPAFANDEFWSIEIY